jgi:hypothetical protein
MRLASPVIAIPLSSITELDLKGAICGMAQSSHDVECLFRLGSVESQRPNNVHAFG